MWSYKIFCLLNEHRFWGFVHPPNAWEQTIHTELYLAAPYLSCVEYGACRQLCLSVKPCITRVNGCSSWRLAHYKNQQCCQTWKFSPKHATGTSQSHQLKKYNKMQFTLTVETTATVVKTKLCLNSNQFWNLCFQLKLENRIDGCAFARIICQRTVAFDRS